MRRALAAAAALALAAALSACNSAVPPASDAAAKAGTVATISPADLGALIARGGAILVDVRTPEEFAAGHLPGAVNLPVESFDPAALPRAEGKETILYCRSDRRSGIAAEKTVAAVGGTIRHLDGGILAWEAAGQPVER